MKIILEQSLVTCFLIENFPIHVQIGNTTRPQSYTFDATNPANQTIIQDIDHLIAPMTLYNEIIAAIDNQESKTSLYTYGKGRVSVEVEGQVSYYVNNEQGSVTDILDVNGNVKVTLKYDEFGILENPEAVSTSGNLFAYTGHVYDESTGLYYAKARYYDAEAGRFTQEDAYHGDGLNLYIYVRNNPMRFVDPSGYVTTVMADGGGSSTNLSGEDVYLLYIGTDFIGRGMDPNILIMQDFLTELLYMKEQQNIDVGNLSIEELDAIYLKVLKGQALKGAATGGGLVAAFQAPALKELTTALGQRAVDKLAIWISGAAKISDEALNWLNKGDANTTVYQGIKNGEAVYTGITKQELVRRLYQHNYIGKRFETLEKIVSDLTRNQARAIEQFLIESGVGNAMNKINSISPDFKYYEEALIWAENFLKNLK